MAMHHDLSIYKTAYELLSLTSDVTRNIPRDLKAGLGAKVRDECISMLLLIAKANSTRDRTRYLEELLERVHTVEFLMRVFRDKKFIGIKQHAAAMLVTASIGRQASGWKKYTATSPAV